MARKILVAEDSPTQAEHIRILLEGEGYQVDVAANGRIALEKVYRERPDLIISDIVMPEMDGYAFCRAVKSDEATRRIPVVLLTGSHGPVGILRGFESGADNFIRKPFESDYLVDRVRRIFENLEFREKGHMEMEVALRTGGRNISITADKQQIVELLFSSFDDLARLNDQLKESQRLLEKHASELETRVQERTERLRTLLSVMHKITSSLDLEEVCGFIVRSASDLLALPYVTVLIREGDMLRMTVEYRDSVSSQGLAVLPVGAGIGGHVAASGEPLYVEDITQDARWTTHEWARREGLRSYLGLPLKQGDEILGVLVCLEKKIRHFTAEEVELMEALADGAAIAIHNAETHSRLEASLADLQRHQQMVIRAEKLSALGTLAAGAAHEVLNPANIIGLFAQRMVQRSGEGTDERMEGETIWRNVERITKICDGLRRFSRNEMPKTEPFEPDKSIEECLQLLGHKLRLGNVRVVREQGAEPAVVSGDHNQMVQVFLNLITNAADAMEGGGTLIVTSRTLAEDGNNWWEVRFADTGTGIPPEILSKIFDPFFTTKPEDKGTGLGLAVTYSIVEAFGGKLWVESPPGEGATFIIRLPLTKS